jgi:hypothetical protein
MDTATATLATAVIAALGTFVAASLSHKTALAQSAAVVEAAMLRQELAASKERDARQERKIDALRAELREARAEGDE